MCSYKLCLSAEIVSILQKRRDLEYLVLGSQSLTELKDNILCFSDYYVETDYSEDPDSFDRKKVLLDCLVLARLCTQLLTRLCM